MPEPLTRGAAETQRSLLARAAPAVLFATLALTMLGDALAVLGLAVGRGWAGCFLALHQPSYWKYAILFTGTLALFVLDMATPRSGELKRAPATARTWPILLLLFVALHFLTAFGAAAPVLARMRAVRASIYAVWALLLFRAAREGGGGRLLAAFLGALLVSALADTGLLLALVRIGGGSLPGRGAGFIGGNANMLAELMLLAVLPGLGLLAGLARARLAPREGTASTPARGGVLFPALALAAVALGLGLIVVSGFSRRGGRLHLNLLSEGLGPKFALGVGLAALAIANLPGRLRRHGFQAAVATALIASCVLFSPAARAHLVRRVHRTSDGIRYYGAIASTRMIAQRPVLGSGPGAYIALAPERQPPEKFLNRHSRKISAHPHNEVLLLAVELGVPGALLSVALTVVAFLACLRRSDALEAAGRAREAGLARGLACALLAACTAQLLDVSLRFWDFAPQFWAALGLAAGLGASTDADAPAPAAIEPARRRALRTGAGVLCAGLAFGFILVPDVRSQRDLVAGRRLERRAREARVRGDEEAARASCERAIATFERAARRTWSGRMHLFARLKVAETLLLAGRSKEAREAAESLLDLVPGEVDALRILATLARQRGDVEAELGYLARWLRLRPYTEPTPPRSFLRGIIRSLSEARPEERPALLERLDLGEGKAGSVGQAYCIGLAFFYARDPKLRDPKRAINRYLFPLYERPGRPGPWPVERELGRMFVMLGEYARAIAALDRYVKDRPDDAAGYVLRAEARLRRHPADVKKAIEDLEEALILAPRRTDVRRQLEALRDGGGEDSEEGARSGAGGHSAPDAEDDSPGSDGP